MKGNRKSVYDYIKKNYPYEEKDEKVICITYAGLIDENSKFSLTSKNKVMNRIEELIEAGVKPNDIFDEDIRLRKEELLIKKAYFAKCAKEMVHIERLKYIGVLGKVLRENRESMKDCVRVGMKSTFSRIFQVRALEEWINMRGKIYCLLII